MRIEFTHTQLLAIAMKYKSGRTLEEIGNEFGCSWQTIQRRLVDLGVPIRHGKEAGVGKPADSSHDKEITELYMSGMSPRQIDKKLNLAMSTARRRLGVLGHKRLIEKKCEHCSKTFYTERPDARFCSPRCRQKEGDRRRYNKKRFDKIDSSITLGVVFEKDNGICYLCGEPCDFENIYGGICGPNYPSVDHVIPAAKGGTDTWDNVRLAHIGCNLRKTDMLLKNNG